MGAWRAIRSCEKEFKLTIAVAANKAVFIQLKFIRFVIHFDIRCKHLGKSNTTCSTRISRLIFKILPKVTFLSEKRHQSLTIFRRGGNCKARKDVLIPYR